MVIAERELLLLAATYHRIFRKYRLFPKSNYPPPNKQTPKSGYQIQKLFLFLKRYQNHKLAWFLISRFTREVLLLVKIYLMKKMEPWTRPLLDIMKEYYHPRDVQKLMEDEIVEISPLAFMRGRTFKNAFILADEMQNATPNQMKMLLTRIGENSRMVVTGDLRQADRLEDNGLVEFIRLLKNTDKNLKYVDIVNFGQKDIERHPAVEEILNIYNE